MDFAVEFISVFAIVLALVCVAVLALSLASLYAEYKREKKAD